MLALSRSRWKLDKSWVHSGLSKSRHLRVLTSARFQNKKTFSFTLTGQVTTGGKFTGLARVGKLRGITLCRREGWLWKKSQKFLRCQGKKTEKRSYLKQKGSAIFIRNLCTDFSWLRPLCCKKLLRMSYLWPSLVSAGAQGELAPSPTPPYSIILRTSLHVASHVLMELWKNHLKLRTAARRCIVATTSIFDWIVVALLTLSKQVF